MIPYGRHNVTRKDIKAVTAVLQSDSLTGGPVVEKFEKNIATHCNVKFAIATNSATSSLHIAYLALGVGKGSLVWTSPITFVATSNAALLCGAMVDFVDIDPETFNLSVKKLEEKLAAAKARGQQLPDVVTPVHMAGLSCDMEGISRLAKEYGFRVIEDASHCIGGKYTGEPIGNCRYSDICVFSFHPVKIITTAEGGMNTTNDPALAKKMVMLRSHGITRDPKLMTHAPDGPWYYQQLELGLNYRMTELQAALGNSQLQRLEKITAKRHTIAGRYDKALKNLPLLLPKRPSDCYSAFHLYIVRLKPEEAKLSHLQLFEGLRKQGILVQLHYIPVHTQPYYRQMGFVEGDFPLAEAYYKTAISLPMYPTLTKPEQEKVVETLRSLLL